MLPWVVLHLLYFFDARQNDTNFCNENNEKKKKILFLMNYEYL